MNRPFKLAMCADGHLDSGLDLERTFGGIAAAGYQGVELAAKFLTADRPVTRDSLTELWRRAPEIRALAAKHGLEIPALHWALADTAGLHLTSADRETRLETARFLAEQAALAAELGAKIIVLGSPHQRRLLDGMTKHAGTQNAILVLDEALEGFVRAGVTLALEPLGPECPDGNFLECAAEAQPIITWMRSPFVRLLLDMKAMLSSKLETEQPPAVIEANFGELAHFHVNGVNLLSPGFHEPGQPYFAPALRKLVELGYSGWVSTEPFRWKTPEFPSIEEQTVESSRYLTACLSDDLPLQETVS